MRVVDVLTVGSGMAYEGGTGRNAHSVRNGGGGRERRLVMGECVVLLLGHPTVGVGGYLSCWFCLTKELL